MFNKIVSPVVVEETDSKNFTTQTRPNAEKTAIATTTTTATAPAPARCKMKIGSESAPKWKLNQMYRGITLHLAMSGKEPAGSVTLWHPGFV